MSDHGWLVRVTAVDGSVRHWRKGGRLHVLSPALGPTWIRHFQRELFQVTPDGGFVPRGSDPAALDIAAVELEPAPEE